MPTLYLHIGTPKTGTTAIQAFCVGNGAALAARGYCYPSFPKDVCDLSTLQNGRFLISAELDENGAFVNPKEEAGWYRGIAHIAERFRDYPNLILSDEMIWWAAKNKWLGLWKNLKAAAESHGFQVKVIVYLRRQDEYISSYWAQKVKSSSPSMYVGKLKWEDAIEPVAEWAKADYFDRIEQIAGYFGRDAIDVRIYDRNRFADGDVVPDFLNAVGMAVDPGISTAGREENLSLSGNVLEIKRILNRTLESDSAMREIFLELAGACCRLDQEQEPASIYSEAERAAILKRYEESNRNLARDYFGDERAQLFAPPKPLSPKWTPDNPRMYESIILYFGLVAQRQQREIEELRSRFFLRNKLRRFKATMWKKVKLLWMKPDRA